MLDITYLLRALDKTILEQQIGTRNLEPFQGIILLKNQSKLLGNYLYVGYYSDGLRLLEDCQPKTPVTMVLSAEDVNKVALPDWTRHNLVISTLDIFDIYNRLNQIVQNYHTWSNSLREALCSGDSLPQLLELASRMLKTQIFILNPGLKLIAGCCQLYLEEPLGRELLSNGCLSYEASLQLLAGSTQAKNGPEYREVRISGSTYHLCEIRHGHPVLAVILLPANPELKQIDIRHLLLDLADMTRNFLLNSQMAYLEQDALCAAFIKDIVEEQLTDENEIITRIHFLPHPLKAFAAFILIHFDSEKLPDPPYDYIFRLLEEIFPGDNMTVYQNEIVILHSQEERPLHNLNFDYEKLEALLKNYHAYAGIGNASRHRPRLRTLYIIAGEALRLGRCLHRKQFSDRIFSYEDYSLYYIVSLCAAQYRNIHHHDDLIYLIHPSIINICRYDAAHKTNLRDVLFYYLLCGCSLNRTASAMYMHRNTVLNKLNKINEIAEIPLEDGYTQQRMIMSCIIVRFYEEYMHMSIRL